MSFDLQDIFTISGVPTETFVKPVEFNRIILNLKTQGRALVIEGPSGIGKTTAVKRALAELGFTDRVAELRSGLRDDAELVRLLPEMKEFGFVFIDDFHKLDREIQHVIADFVKVLADEGRRESKVIIVGISEAGNSLIQLAPDLVNRIDVVRFETNPDEKIEDLINKGESALNIEIACKSQVIEEANGGFYIAQMLCSEICTKASIFQTQTTKTTIDISFEGIKGAIWKRLDARFKDACKAFCLGSRYRPEGMAPYLHLMYWLANSRGWYLDINECLRANQDMKLSVLQVMDKGYLNDLFAENATIRGVVYYDDKAKKLVIEDPQFLFYIRSIPWKSFAKELGFRQIGFQSRYDYALSFCRDDWDIAAKVFEILTERETAVFYDRNEQDRIAWENIEEYLAPIYSSDAMFVVCIVSAGFPSRIWTRFESKQFQHRFELGEVVPVLVKGTDVGAFSKLSEYGYLIIERSRLEESAAEVCGALISKLIKHE